MRQGPLTVIAHCPALLPDNLCNPTLFIGIIKDTTGELYRELADELAGDGAPVKFVIDILSGTSAGGINAVFLAKALVRGCPSLSSLENFWLEEDIDKLLNDLQSELRKCPSLCRKGVVF